MAVWAERPVDGGSAVWGCSTCDEGGWCSDHTTALIEARLHAEHHADGVEIIGQQRGPQPDHDRDRRIRARRASGASIRTIATAENISPSGVIKSLRRTT